MASTVLTGRLVRSTTLTLFNLTAYDETGKRTRFFVDLAVSGNNTAWQAVETALRVAIVTYVAERYPAISDYSEFAAYVIEGIYESGESVKRTIERSAEIRIAEARCTAEIALEDALSGTMTAEEN